MKAPRFVKSVEVTNNTAADVVITVTYESPSGGEATPAATSTSMTIAANATHHFEEKTVDMGGWTAVQPVSTVSVDGGPTHTPEPTEIVNKLGIKLQAADDGSLAFAEV